MANVLAATSEVLSAPTPAPDARIASLAHSFLWASALTVLWVACRLWFAFDTPRPLAFVHDEFSYLLAADTFAHGRMTNPPHPLGKFFESPHVLVRPTYMAKYPPGQGLFLALGQKLFGSPFWGVVIEGAAMIFVFTLMLCAWVSVPWAISVSVAIAIYFLPPMYWVNSYWGGCAAAVGAAAVLFGIGRHRFNRWPIAGGVVALGLVLLFLTRPYEGGIFAIAALSAYGRLLWRDARSGRVAQLAPAMLLAGPILLAALVWTGFYNKAVTGNPLQLPYLAFERQYNATPIFWFQAMRPEPHYSHPQLELQLGSHGTEAAQWRTSRHGWFTLLYGIREALQVILPIPGPIAPLILLLPLAWRDFRVRLSGFIVGACILALSLEVFTLSHYGAPAFAALTVMLAVIAENAARYRRSNKPVGAILAASILLAGSLFGVGYHTWKMVAAPKNTYLRDFAEPRQHLIERLSKRGGKQLVIVQYPPGSDEHNEWVYNSADIDGQRIVFAHDLGARENKSLLSYYNDRKPWLLVPGGKGYNLAPYRSD